MRRIILAGLGCILMLLAPLARSGQVFLDNFNRADNTTIGGNWVEVNTGFGGNAQISGNALSIVNGATSGRSYVFQNTTNWGAAYRPTLNQTVGLVSWRFNLRVNRANLSGFALANYGVGLVLAANSTNFLAGNGYAVIWGQNLTDPLRLVLYTNGLQTSGTIALSNLITASEGGFTNMTTDYYSIRVTYDPDAGVWELYARDDGTTSFADPATGVLTLVGSVTNTTYTGTALNYMGPFWNYGTSPGQSTSFDNLTAEVIQLPPSFVTPPTNQLVIRGSNATVSVTAAGTRPLGYQWRFNGTNLIGRTNTTLTLTNFLEANEGGYDVVVTNAFGTNTSSTAMLAISRDFGDAPAPYPTLLLNSGARHIVAPGVYLGALVDGETNGQPNAQATGDEGAGAADEDGVAFVSRVAAGQTATIQVTASTNGFLNAWMDFNQNGSWLDTGEQIFTGQFLSAGVNVLNFPVPAAAAAGTNAYCRFRFTSAAGLGFITGEAADGEVEDYQVAIDTPADVAVGAVGAPNPVTIGSNLTYTVSVTNFGPSQASGVKLTNLLAASVNFVSATPSQGAVTQAGGIVTCDFGGLLPGKKASLTIVVVPTTEATIAFTSTLTANETDPNPANNSASVNTSVLPRPVIVTQPASLTVTNGDTAGFSVAASGHGTLLYQWRFNGVNLAGATNSFLSITDAQSSNAGPYDVVVNDIVGSVTSDAATLTVLVRPFIITQPEGQVANIGGNAVLSVAAGGTPTLFYQWYFNGTNLLEGQTAPTLALNDVQTNNAGEYTVTVTNDVGSVTSAAAVVTVQPMDFGDAPTNYPTLLASNGARHVLVPDIYLGNGLSQDADGKPDAAADLDDLDDGVSFITNMVAGQTATVQIVASTNGYLTAWIDFDSSGNWEAPYKRIFNGQPLIAGTNTFDFEVPYFAQAGQTFARFRFTTDTNVISFDGLAPDGEVEDYQVSIAPATAVGLVVSVQPSDIATAGVVFDLQPSIIIADNRGQPVFSDSTTSVTAVRDAGAGTLQGTVTQTAINGTVVFTNLFHTLVSEITLQFAGGSFTAVTSSVVSVRHNVASQLAVLTQPSASAVAGQVFAQQPVVRVTDAYGNLIGEDNGTLVTASRGAGLGTLQGTLSQTTTNGVATFTNLSHQAANTITVVFNDSGLAPATSASILITPTNANKLVFTTQPGGAVAGAPFGIQPVVRTQDVFGNASTVGLPASLVVTQSLTAGTGPLQGTTTADIGTAAGNGQVTFTNLRIDTGGSGKQLTASAAGMTNAVSSSFSVIAATYLKLQLLAPGETAAPGTATGKTGSANSQAPDTAFNVTVNAVDAFWNVVNTVTNLVHFSLSDTNVAPPTNQALASGTKVFPMTLTTPGVQTITVTDATDGSKIPGTNSITINTAPYTFATGGGAISADLSTNGAPSVLLTGPTYSEAVNRDVGSIGTIIFNAPSGFVFDTSATVSAAVTRLDTASQTLLTLSNTISVTSNTIITGVATLDSANGGTKARAKITWSGIKVRPSAGTPLARGNITKSGTVSLAGVTSASDFGPLREIPGASRRLVMVTQPSATATAGALFSQQPAVGVADQFGNIRNSTNGTAAPDNSTVITAARSAGTGTLQGTLTATANDSIASFTNLSHTVANTITITFTNSALATNVNSSNVVVNPAPADRLVFSTQPGSAVAGAPFGVQPVVVSRDSFGNASAVGLPATFNVVMSLTSGVGPLLGTTARNIGTGGGNGTVSNTDLRIDSVAASNQLTASVSGPPNLASATSGFFAVAKGNQTITFAALSNRVYGEVFTVTPSASSGLPVGIEILSGPATNSSNIITITGIGLVVVRATQPGDDNFFAAPPVDRSFTANKANVGIAITPSANPSLPSQQVTFSATVSAAPPGNGTPGGTVQFTTNSSALEGPVTLTNGMASVAAALVQHGSNSVTVTYGGDVFFNAGTNSLSPQQVVNTPPVAGADTVERPPGPGVKVLATTLLTNDSDADGDAVTLSIVNTNSTGGGTISLQDGWVFYTAPPELTNGDTFYYQLADPLGGTAQGTVSVVVGTNTAPTINLLIEDLGNGSFRLSFDGVPGESYLVQYATDLENPDWQTLTTQTADALGRFEYVDTPPPGSGTRFYRSASQ